GKSICAFPDVCFTPPQTPATPPGVPIPYPNTGMAKDTTSGSKKVKISGQEVLLKNKSYFKKSTGDEAGNAPKKGIITSTNKGKVYFNAWSMDVKVEGENVVRHLDLTTHNHNPPPGQTPPHPYLDSSAIGNPPECDDLNSTLDATVEEELPESRKKGATIGLGMTQGAPGSMVGGASSISASTVRRGGKYAHWSEGIEQGEPSNVKTCDGDTFEYAESGRPKEGHAEAKMIEDFFKNGAKGTLVIAVSKSPCKDCSRLINEVNKGKDGKECNKIVVCESSV
ncbi:MAG: DUF4150 domain-containing protein, partial [Chromatiaceae bacterium]|nr:DUF4150 domain-containing protein [Chromatiaceae bacterium]